MLYYEDGSSEFQNFARNFVWGWEMRFANCKNAIFKKPDLAAAFSVFAFGAWRT
jgi:hypothetical protein